MFGVFGPPTRFHERCSCGSEFTATGTFAAAAIASWRADHVCTKRRAARFGDWQRPH